MKNSLIALIFIGPGLCVYGLIWLILKWPWLLRFFTDKPDSRKVHQRSIPRIGGFAILSLFLLFIVLITNSGFISIIETFTNFTPIDPILLKSIILASVTIFIIGFIDDSTFIKISNSKKLLAEILIASIIVIVFGLRLEEFNLFNKVYYLGWMGYPLTIIWIVGVTNALNMIDGADGLAGTIILVILCTIAMLNGFTQDIGVAIICLVLCSMVVGFLFHNYSPARTFLGDTGSLFFGILIGVLSIYTVSPKFGNQSVVIAPLLVGFPILDVFLAMMRRYFKAVINNKVKWYKAFKFMTVADNEHIHHRLIHSGLVHFEVCAVLGILQIVFCATAICISLIIGFPSLILIAYMLAIIFWIIFRLDFINQSIADFGVAIKNLTSKKTAQKPDPVAIIHTDGIFYYSLKSYKSELFTFDFLPTLNALFDYATTKKYSAIVINNVFNDYLRKEILAARQVSEHHSCPIIIITSENLSEEDTMINNDESSNILYVIRKPVYIPLFLEELYTIIQNNKNNINKQTLGRTRYLRVANFIEA
jgi:UDP-GlcNAc:undecaprenyl-phosphate GlcNAc-1-phosphate transferase